MYVYTYTYVHLCMWALKQAWLVRWLIHMFGTHVIWLYVILAAFIIMASASPLHFSNQYVWGSIVANLGYL